MERKVGISLLLLRLGIFLVMFMWTLDKFFNPGHAGKVFANFYGIEGLGSGLFTVLAAGQMIVIIIFLSGAIRRVSYGLVLAMHTVSTLSSWRQYLDPFDNLLFFAAWPMLAACIALYLLRDHDNLLSLNKGRQQ